MTSEPSSPMPVAGVMGWPISHSLSPRLHGFWLNSLGIPGAYVPFAVPPTEIAAAIRGVRALGLRGVNVTVPHKEAVLEHLDDVDPLAARLGAVNTVWRDSQDRLCGLNSDLTGFAAALDDAGTDWRQDQRPALVLGAGGAARAVVAALIAGSERAILVANRTTERARALTNAVGGEAIDWAAVPGAAGGASLVVNATSLGMVGQPALDADLSALPPGAIVMDLVYAPLETPLLAWAKAHGHRPVDGLGMLLHQARVGFDKWFGVDPPVTEALRQHVLAAMA